MRVMVIVKASKDSEAGVMPSTAELAAMGQFNEELVKAGMMLAGDGLQATRRACASTTPATSAPWSTAPSPRPKN